METKKCFKCEEVKPLSDYYKHKKMADGHLNKCKKCTKGDVSSHRAANLEKTREYDRKRGGLRHRIESNTKRTKEFRRKFPERYKAHIALNNAVRDGKIHKPELCSVCGLRRQIEGHHDDYNKPIDVVWLCSACHSKLHAELSKTK